MSRELIHCIEQACLWAWPPTETAYVDGWLLRAAEASPRRVNSVRPDDFDAAADPDRAIAAVEKWYGARAKPPCFQISDVARPAGLDSRLETRGYQRLTPSAVLTYQLPATVQAVPAGVDLHHRLTQSVANALFDPRWPDGERRTRATLLARIRPPHRFALIVRDGVPAAAGLVVVDRELAGIFAMRTQQSFRGQGLGAGTLGALLVWAGEQGATTAYLQVEDANAPARTLYERSGFARAYGYHYRERS